MQREWHSNMAGLCGRLHLCEALGKYPMSFGGRKAMSIIQLKNVVKVLKAFNKLNFAERRQFLRSVLPWEWAQEIETLEWNVKSDD